MKLTRNKRKFNRLIRRMEKKTRSLNYQAKRLIALGNKIGNKIGG